MELKLEKFLQGTRIGMPQTVGPMTVLPLIMDKELMDNRFASPKDIEVSTTHYGKLQFKNDTGKPVIMPMNSAYVVKQAAQDHALPGVGFIKGKSKTFDYAACIQQSQGGTIPSGKQELVILPFTLREDALGTKNEKKFGKLWPSIDKFNRRIGVKKTGAHLEYFLQQFNKELDQFIAEFELIENQIGAIVLINGEVIGIEKTPSAEYFADIFKPLIRECYGSIVLEMKNPGSIFDEIKPPKYRKDISKAKVTNASEILAIVELVDKEEKDNMEIIFNSIKDDVFVIGETQNEDGISLSMISNSHFNGQIIEEGDYAIYASLGTKSEWVRGAKGRKAKDFEF